MITRLKTPVVHYSKMSVKYTFIITWEKNNENKGDAVNFLLDSQMILRCVFFFLDFN